MATSKRNHRLGLKVILGFALLFIAVLLVNALFGVGINQLMRWLDVSPDVRVYLGSTVSYGSRLLATVFISAWMLRKILGLDARRVMFPLRKGWWKNLLFGVLLAAVAMALLFLVEMLVGWLLVEGWNWQVLPSDAWLRNLWLAILINATVAVSEETVFRGYLLTGLVKVWGKWRGLLLMALLFSLPHLTVTGAEETNWLLFTFLLVLPSLMLGFAYLRSRSLWLPIGIHFAWNIMQDDILNLHGRGVPSQVGALTTQQGPGWIVGTAYGIEVGLAGIAVFLLVSLGVWLWTRRYQHPPDTEGLAADQETA